MPSQELAGSGSAWYRKDKKLVFRMENPKRTIHFGSKKSQTFVEGASRDKRDKYICVITVWNMCVSFVFYMYVILGWNWKSIWKVGGNERSEWCVRYDLGLWNRLACIPTLSDSTASLRTFLRYFNFQFQRHIRSHFTRYLIHGSNN